MSESRSAPDESHSNEPKRLPEAFCNWKSSRNWLIVRHTADSIHMFCSVCLTQRPRSSGGRRGGSVWWTTQCRRVKLHSVKDHEASKAHQQAIETELKQRQMERTGGFGAAVVKHNLLLNDRSDRAVVCVMKALYWNAKENIPLRKWHLSKGPFGASWSGPVLIRCCKECNLHQCSHYDTKAASTG